MVVSPAQPGPAKKITVTIEDAMTLAVEKWQLGETQESIAICQKILEARPDHQGGKHLMASLSFGVNSGLFFTAIKLNYPFWYSIGEFSYGLPTIIDCRLDEDARLVIGNYCAIGHDVEMYLGSYHRADTFSIFPFSAPHFGELFSSAHEIKDYSSTKGGIEIGNDVWIGAGSKIMSGVSIGDGAVIGAGAIVTKDVGPYEVWAGNPAIFKKRRFDEVTADRLFRIRWWDWPKDVIEANAREIMSSTNVALQYLERVSKELLEKMNDGSQFVYARGYSSFLRVKLPEQWLVGRSTWLVLHGSLGSIESVWNLSQHILDVNLVYVDLPGCGKSMAPRDMTVAGFAAELLPALDDLIQGDYRILGASFGGAVGLEVARRDARCKGVILLDTPFSALKLWHNHIFLRGLLAQRPDDRFLRRFAHEIYGVTDVSVFERDFWYLLDGQTAPIIAVTGDLPMMPPRQVPPVPCCLDEEDIHRLVSMGVSIRRIAGGHNLINDNPTAVATLLSEMGRESVNGLA